MFIKFLFTYLLLQFNILCIDKKDLKVVYYTVVLKDISLTANGKETVWLGSHDLKDNRILSIKDIKKRILLKDQRKIQGGFDEISTLSNQISKNPNNLVSKLQLLTNNKGKFDELSYTTSKQQKPSNQFDEQSMVTSNIQNQRSSITGTLKGKSFIISNTSVSHLSSSNFIEKKYDQRSCQFQSDFFYENNLEIIEHMIDPENLFLQEAIKNVPTLQQQKEADEEQLLDFQIAQDLNKKVEINLAQDRRIDFIQSKTQKVIAIDLEESHFESYEYINFTLYQEMTIELKTGKRISKWDGVPVSIKVPQNKNALDYVQFRLFTNQPWNKQTFELIDGKFQKVEKSQRAKNLALEMRFFSFIGSFAQYEQKKVNQNDQKVKEVLVVDLEGGWLPLDEDFIKNNQYRNFKTPLKIYIKFNN